VPGGQVSIAIAVDSADDSAAVSEPDNGVADVIADHGLHAFEYE